MLSMRATGKPIELAMPPFHLREFGYESMRIKFLLFRNELQTCRKYFVIEFVECRNDSQDYVNTSYCRASPGANFEIFKTFKKRNNFANLR
jgi:hypothetical protein